jgi:SAM-dependent methyltransferase
MKRLALWYGFRRRRPWVSQFAFDGRTYGGYYDTSDDPRIVCYLQHFSNAKRILELGSLEGAHTLRLAALPGVELVLGLEGRAESVKRARFVQRCVGVRNVEFRHVNLEEFRPSTCGRFDVVFCVGLLYHLPEPWRLLADLPAAAPAILLSTHYAPDEKTDCERSGYPGAIYGEKGMRDPLSGLSAESFWPTRDALLAMVRAAGYSRIEVCRDDMHGHGPLLTLAAWTGSASLSCSA